MRAVRLQGATNAMLKEFLTSGLAVSAANVCTNPIGVCTLHAASLGTARLGCCSQRPPFLLTALNNPMDAAWLTPSTPDKVVLLLLRRRGQGPDAAPLHADGRRRAPDGTQPGEPGPPPSLVLRVKDAFFNRAALLPRGTMLHRLGCCSVIRYGKPRVT